MCVHTTLPLVCALNFAHKPFNFVCIQPCTCVCTQTCTCVCKQPYHLYHLNVHRNLPLLCAHNTTICVCTQPRDLYTNLQPECVHNPATCVYSVHTTIPLKCARNPPTCVSTQICHLCLHTTLQYMKMNTKEKPYTDFEILSCINEMEKVGLIMTSNDTIFFLTLYLVTKLA